jgi:hypothetical protein
MHRSLPRSGQLFRMLVFFDALAGAFAYGIWRWAERNEATALRTPASRLWAEMLLFVAAVLLAAALLRWAVYRSSSWEPSFLVAVAAVVTTPPVGALLMRSIAVAEFGERHAPAGGLQLRHQTNAARMGQTKRLSEL